MPVFTFILLNLYCSSFYTSTMVLLRWMHLFWVLHKMEKKRKSHLIQGRLLFSLAHLASDAMAFSPQWHLFPWHKWFISCFSLLFRFSTISRWLGWRWKYPKNTPSYVCYTRQFCQILNPPRILWPYFIIIFCILSWSTRTQHVSEAISVKQRGYNYMLHSLFCVRHQLTYVKQPTNGITFGFWLTLPCYKNDHKFKKLSLLVSFTCLVWSKEIHIHPLYHDI
jgi:hypothetical protein